ncbi:MAG: GNAT family N-acetyltransferase [Archaeoglobaceae archaeon]
MKIRELRDEDLVDAVRILALCFEKELTTIFKDVDIARELLMDFFRENKNGCYVAEDERVVAFAWLLSRKQKIFGFLRKKIGFVDGLRAYLLLRFFVRTPKKGEGFLVFICTSPLRLKVGIGSALMQKIINRAKEEGLESLKCIAPADSDSVLFFKKMGFEISNLFNNRLAEKYFSSREWVLMTKDLSA